MRLAVTLFVLALILAGGAGFAAYREWRAPGPLTEAATEVVPHGGLGEVAAALQKGGVIRHGWAFQLAARLTESGGPVHAGEFAFPAGASLREVLLILRTAKPIQHKLTIPEGLSARQVMALLDAAPALEGADPAIAEGSLLPQTYLYERGTTRAALVLRAQQAMDKALDQAWSTRSPDLPLAGKQDALTLASIIERETAKPEERPMVAAVYLNRLRRGMKLQSDPTVVYGASHGLGVLDHGLSKSELEADTPYNTYRNAGLPPGPICMPGVSAIEAATHPADTEALYFVADGTGGHAFARTEQEHARNVAKWRAVERSRAEPVSP